MAIAWEKKREDRKKDSVDYLTVPGMNPKDPLGSACGLLYLLISAVYRVDYPLSIGSKPKGYRHRPLGRWLHVIGMYKAVIHTVGYNGWSVVLPVVYIYISGHPPLATSKTNKSQNL